MLDALISRSRRVRSTPYTKKVEAAGVKSYTVYNHMLLPTVFESPEVDYWHLCEHVQVWDVSIERQVELRGPDAARLAQLMTPRDLSEIDHLQGKYAPICNAHGYLINDPIVIKLGEQQYWMSIADSDVKLFAQGLAQGYQLDVDVFEPEVFPLAVQGPKAEELMSRVFGEVVRDIRFFRGEMLKFQGREMYVARSGWSKQDGFEIYLNDAGLAEPLWDALFTNGKDLNVRAGCPNSSERMEGGLLSYGNDMDEFDTPFECGLDRYLDLDADLESLSLQALRDREGMVSRRIVGLSFHELIDFSDYQNYSGGYDIKLIGETIGEIRSHAWSYRYQKHLALAMLPLTYIDRVSTLVINGREGKVHPTPFNLNEL